MKNFFFYTLSLVSLLINVTNAQELTSNSNKYTAHSQGKFFISWGGNREIYSNSDITFRGEDYNFTLHNAQAHDKPKGWHMDYINPTKMTIPQTNFIMGYFINDHYSLAIGVDHMKYVMTQDQTTNIDGYYPNPGSYDELIIGNPNQVVLTDKFLTFEHTDGLNYVFSEISRHDDISSLFYIHNTDIIQVNLTEGIGLGALYPKTNAKILGKDRHDDFHVSGFGTSIKVGLNFTFFKHFFIQTEAKGGYINMSDIRTSRHLSDRASQEFFFLQSIFSIGGIFRI
ncbi:hypothetical protein [Flavobacterium faecale]|uniref:hypothetical protein n=1 Tax=Flavobacterium faecale TaxID=1355330 RepID=UPI003AAFEC05